MRRVAAGAERPAPSLPEHQILAARLHFCHLLDQLHKLPLPLRRQPRLVHGSQVGQLRQEAAGFVCFGEARACMQL